MTTAAAPARSADPPAAARPRFSPRRLRDWLETILSSGSGDQRRPRVGKGNESNVKGLHIIGDLAGAPVIKLAMAQGVEVIDYLSTLPEMKERATGGVLDVLVVGAGAAGLNAALAARERGWSCVVLEKEKIANTIENFPEGKWVYAEPDATPPKGKLWLDGAQKEQLVARWQQIVRENGLDVRTEQPLRKLAKRDGLFVATTPAGELRARKVVLATGQRGNPRKLGAQGEQLEHVYHRLYSPRKYEGERILVVGGGNSAIEAALTLAERNRVVLSYRGGEFARVFKDNARKLDEAIAARRVEVLFHSTVKEFRRGETTLLVDRGGHREERVVPSDHAFVLVGAELPMQFLKSLGIRLENEWEGSALRAALLTLLTLLGLCWLAPALGGRAAWFGLPIGFVPPLAGGLLAAGALAALVATGCRGDRWSWLGLSFWIWYSVYGIKYGKGEEFWPYAGWGYQALSFKSFEPVDGAWRLVERPWSFWYTVAYTGLMTIFGLRALKRWGIDRKDRFQVWRYTSLLAFQWILFFLVPEFLFQYAVKYEWVGRELAADAQFRDQAWRSYGLVYAWPLFVYTFLYDPHKIWVVWGVLLTFVVIPLFVIFQGKRYCSWICGCGGLAETFGDRWRHLAAKGRTAIRFEAMALAVLVAAFVVTLMMLMRDTWRLWNEADSAMRWYRVVADCWLVGILPVTLYPFLGGKVWCRYWCPLAKGMQYLSALYAKLGISRFRIVANDKCIACGECSRNCQVGIPVMQYALKQEVLDNQSSSCIGCGICVTVCPMDTLSFGREEAKLLPVVPDRPR